MPIKLTFQQINNPDFFEAMEVIDRTSTLKVKTMARFNKLRTACDTHAAEARALFKKLREKYAVMEEVEEGGKIVSRPKLIDTPQGKQVALNDVAGFEKEADEFLKDSFEVPIHPFALEEFDGCGLTPKQVRALDIIVQTPDGDKDDGPRLIKDR